MSFSSDQPLLINQLPISIEFPENDMQGLVSTISLREKLTASILNTKVGGLHTPVELFNSEQYVNFNDPTAPLINVYQKSFDVVAANSGNIAPGATVTFAHNITGIVRLVGWPDSGYNTSVPDFRSFPYTDATAVTNQVQVTVNATNIIVVNGATAPTITAFILTLKYVKN